MTKIEQVEELKKQLQQCQARIEELEKQQKPVKTDYKPGDLVRVLPDAREKMITQFPYWTPRAERSLGKIVKILKYIPNNKKSINVDLDGQPFWLTGDCVEPAEAPEEQVQESDVYTSKPKEGEIYYCFNVYFHVYKKIWDGGNSDNYLWENNIFFYTKEIAESVARKKCNEKNFNNALRLWQYENDIVDGKHWVPNWSNKYEKKCYLDHCVLKNNNLGHSFVYVYMPVGEIVLISEQNINAAVNWANENYKHVFE